MLLVIKKNSRQKIRANLVSGYLCFVDNITRAYQPLASHVSVEKVEFALRASFFKTARFSARLKGEAGKYNEQRDAEVLLKRISGFGIFALLGITAKPCFYL